MTKSWTHTHATKIKQHQRLKNLYTSYIYAVNHMWDVYGLRQSEPS